MNKITSENWLEAPNNKESFQKVESLFDSVRIKRSSQEPSRLPQNLKSLDSIQIQDIEGQNQTFKEMLTSTHTDAFLVLKDGEILFEEYFNDMKSDSFHLMNSITKSFVGMLVGVLADKGILNIKEKVTKYVPELNDGSFSDTTIQSALDMSSAVKFEEDYADPLCDFWKESAVVGWRPDLVNDNSPSSLLDFAMSLKDKEQEEVGGYHYRSVLTNVIAMVVERATNENLIDLLEEHIWHKLKTEQDAVIVVDKEGLPFVGAGMNACARDLARFGQMILNDGVYEGEQIVSKEWIDSTRTGDDGYKERFARSDHGEMLPGGHYKNYMWVVNQEEMMCIGIYGQTIHINRNTGVVIVKFSSFPEPAEELMFANTFILLATVSNSV
ncbi:MAG: class C beta-lactamase-related serine hydrolase [Gammaproteobacteria bacterium]|nr:MAG: class C beta-lactamase-related serine hydrolase [Gammaproteobacteria bacterium]